MRETLNMSNITKSSLRIHMKQIIKTMSLDDRKEQSEKIAQKLYSSSAFRLAQRVCIYLSMPSEVDTIPILRSLFQHNKEVYIPYYVGANMEMVRLHDMADYERLSITKWNIRQPDATNAHLRETASASGLGLDLILIPGVAFERRQHRAEAMHDDNSARTGGVARLGHGMGYYDKYLHQLMRCCPHKKAPAANLGMIDNKFAAGHTVLLGLAFNQQIVGNVPIDEHDMLLDDVFTAE